jgi:FkbM family methyltransferase
MNYIHLKIKLKSAFKYLNFKEAVYNYFRNKTTNFSHNEIVYKFSTPNELCEFRVKSLLIKEPETIYWIDTFLNGSIFWDIGANVGMYSVYAAKSKQCKVYSFEPSVFNLEILARNIYLNNLTSSVTIMPFAVSDKIGEGNLNMSSTEIGGALSTYDKSYGEDGEEMKVVFNYPVFSISLDQAVQNLKLDFPDYVKIDVDGIELLILQGATDVLCRIKGLLIEISENWEIRKFACEDVLEKSGLKKMSFNSEYLKGRDGSPNQIWIRE